MSSKFILHKRQYRNDNSASFYSKMNLKRAAFCIILMIANPSPWKQLDNTCLYCMLILIFHPSPEKQLDNKWFFCMCFHQNQQWCKLNTSAQTLQWILKKDFISLFAVYMTGFISSKRLYSARSLSMCFL